MSNLLTELSNGFAAVVETASASMVRVDGRRRQAATGIIWSADGLIVTADHVLRTNDKVVVGLPDGQTAEARLVGRDPSTDLALLQVDGVAGWATLPTADDLKVGHLVLALGRPGHSVQATWGILSALGGEWRTGAGGHMARYIQTDVLMYPGFSGGPLVNAGGQLVGLNSSALARGASVTIPTATLERVANSLQTHGKMKRGYLGISTQAVRLPQALVQELGQETGLLIAGVEGGSPAEAGGLFLGDTIVAVAGAPIRQHDDLVAQLNGSAGQKTPIRLVRGGQVHELQVVVGEKD
ncbi:MAG: trypsin-like peptidase domain-containing protein [Chloroflexi bacterium]|nr:trypsin-like peptidase domain-containing protein [Chloroflexota bacterium]